MCRHTGLLVAFAGLLFVNTGWAGSTPAVSLLVLSKGDHTLTIVDPTNLKAVARMPSGPDPHEVIASADGKFAYISNYGGGAYNTLTLVDLIEQKTVGPIDLGALRGPHGLAQANGKIWFTAEAAKAIGSYDPTKKTIDWILGTGQNRTHMILVSPSAEKLVTSNVSSATLTFIEKSKGNPAPGPRGMPPPGAGGNGPRGPRGSPMGEWDETIVPVGRGAEGFDISPNDKEIWAANAQDGTISVVDYAAKKVVDTLNADVKGANRLKFTPDGKLVFVSTLNGPDVTILDAATRKITKRVKVGRGAAGIEVQPDGTRVFVSCTPDNYVAIIDRNTLTVTGHLDAGKQPDGLAWAIRR